MSKNKVDAPEGWDDVTLPEWLVGAGHPKKWVTPLYLAATEYYQLAEVETQIAGLEALIAKRGEGGHGGALGDEDEATEQLALLREERDELRPVVRESEKKVQIQNPLTSDEIAARFRKHRDDDGNLDEDALALDLLKDCQSEPSLSRAGWEALQRAVGVGQWEQFKGEILEFLHAPAVKPDFSRGSSRTSPE